MSGKFIVFEGIDSSGKKTQSTLLAERLVKEGKRVEILHFPTYKDTPLGVFVSKYLRGDFGTKESITPEIGSIIYSLDRYQVQGDIKEKLESGINIVCDRYTPSNIFQASKVEGEEVLKMWEWIKCLDKRLPKPDMVVLLNVPANVSTKLFSGREKKNRMMNKERDIHEEDVEYQERVRNNYLKIAKMEEWIVIKCFREVNGNFEILKPQEISDEAYKKLKDKNVI